MKLRAACVLVGLFSLFLSLVQASLAQTTAETTSSANDASSQSNVAPTLSGGGTKHYIPLWLSSGELGNSKLFQTEGEIGIGTTSPTATLDVNGAINVATRYKLGGTAFVFGSYTNQNAFLGFAGNSTNSGIQNTASGVGALQSDTTGHANTAYGVNALNVNTTGADNTALGLFALSSNTTGSANTAIGEQTLASDTTGDENTAVGHWVLLGNTTGQGNIAVGWKTLIGNTTGDDNTAIGFLTLQGNNTGSNNTALGAFANVGSSDLTNATAVGAYAFVGQSNALVLGSINGVNGATASTNVGIGTTTPANVFTIAQGAGDAISDGWHTYSSRRWKSNIQTLHGALEKVVQLRGVSYDLKESGKHEVGVIAEEVGAVVPEVVSYDENGKDARGVDYSRLTALLIEATKEQQALIRDQEGEIRNLQERLGKMESALAAVSPR
jgi:hypothetical protein